VTGNHFISKIIPKNRFLTLNSYLSGSFYYLRLSFKGLVLENGKKQHNLGKTISKRHS
jgi:hypothetical protein